MLSTRIAVYATYAKLKMKKFLTNEKGEVNIIATVLLIGIAVGLAIIFKDKITELLNNLFGKLSSSADGAMDNAVSGD